MESDLHSNRVMSARQNSQNFLNEKAEAKPQRHVPQGTGECPSQRDRQTVKRREAGRDTAQVL